MRQLDKGLQKGFYVCVHVVSVSVSLPPNLLFHSFLPLFKILPLCSQHIVHFKHSFSLSAAKGEQTYLLQETWLSLMPASFKPLLYYFGTENSSFSFCMPLIRKKAYYWSIRKNIFTPQISRETKGCYAKSAPNRFTPFQKNSKLIFLLCPIRNTNSKPPPLGINFFC